MRASHLPNTDEFAADVFLGKIMSSHEVVEFLCGGSGGDSTAPMAGHRVGSVGKTFRGRQRCANEKRERARNGIGVDFGSLHIVIEQRNRDAPFIS